MFKTINKSLSLVIAIMMIFTSVVPGLAFGYNTVDAEGNPTTDVISEENETVSGINGLSTTPSAVTGLAVKTPPDKTNYIEGEKLILEGLTVTLQREEGSTNINFADFSENGIVTDPANNAVLATDHTAITITHAESGKSVQQFITVTPVSEGIGLAADFEQEPVDDKITDGIYTIDVAAWKETGDTLSNMASALAPQATLKIKDEKITATIKFVPTTIMGLPVTGADIAEVWAEPEGALMLGTGTAGIVNEEEKSNVFTFELSTLELPKLSMTVTPMNNAIMTIRLKFEMATLTKVSDSPGEPETKGCTITINEVEGGKGVIASVMDPSNGYQQVTLPVERFEKNWYVALKIQNSEEGYQFVEWQVDKGDITLNNKTDKDSANFTVGTENIILTPIFKKTTVDIIQGDNGAITVRKVSDGEEIANGTHVIEGTEMEIVPQAEAGYRIVRMNVKYLWDHINTVQVYPDKDGKFIITMPERTVEITPVFREALYKVESEVEGQGEISRDIASEKYAMGERITFTAAPAQGWVFVGWHYEKDGYPRVSTESEWEFDVFSADVAIKAVFGQETLSFKLNNGENGSAKIERNSKERYAKGEIIEISATPNEGYKFIRWEFEGGNIEYPTGSYAVFTIEQDNASATPVFAKQQKVTVTSNDSERGTVKIQYSSVLTGLYLPGQAITLQATALEGWKLDKWESTDVTGSFENEKAIETKYTVGTSEDDVTIKAIFSEDASTLIPDGQYEIGVVAYKEGTTALSMMAALLDKTAIVNVVNGKYTVTIKFISGAIMGIPVSGSDVKEVWPERYTAVDLSEIGTGLKGTYDEATDSQTYTFEVSTLKNPRLYMNVERMGMRPAIDLGFDTSTLPEVAAEKHDITVNAGEGGAVNTAGGSFEAGQTIDLTATPNDGYKFTGWTVTGAGTVADVASASTIFTVGAGDATVTANFEQEQIDDKIADGIYTIAVAALHETNDTPSAMASALEPQVTLRVENEKITATIKFIKTVLYTIPVNGNHIREVWPETENVNNIVVGTGLNGVYNEADESKTFTFEISTLDKPKLSMFVESPMNSVQTIRLNFDKATLTKISDLSTDEPNLEEPVELPDGIVQPSEKENVVTLDKEALKTWIDGMDEEEKKTMAVSIPVQKGTEGSVDGAVVIPVTVLESHIDDAESLQIIIEKVTSGDEQGAKSVLPANTTIIQGFDVKLIKVVNGGVTEEVHNLNGKVKVIITLTAAQKAELSGGTPRLFHYNPVTKTLNNMNATFEDSTAAFYTEHFSAYVITVTKTGDGNNGGGNVPSPELDPNNLADGRYTIMAEALKENNNTYSMAHGLIVQPLQLDVEGGKIWVSMLLKSTGEYPLEEVKMLWYRDKSGNYKETDLTYNASSQTIVLEFPTNSITKEQYMKVDVPIITDNIGKQIFRLVFDTDTLKKGGSMKDPSSISPATPANEFVIKASAGDGGTITPSGDVKVQKGKNQEFVIKANEGYKIKHVIVDGKSVGSVETYTFKDVQKGATISVSFEKTDGAGSSAEFADISGHWAENVIKIVVEKGLLVGTGDNKFSPDLKVTRGMLVTILGRLAGADISSYESSKFNDVDFAQYYAKSIAWAAEAGIVAGVADDRFAPDTEITREQLAVIFMNYAKFAEIDLTKTTDETTDFADIDEISSWAKSSVTEAQKAGLVSGKENNLFDPKGTATRAEVAAILVRLLDIIEAQ